MCLGTYPMEATNLGESRSRLARLPAAGVSTRSTRRWAEGSAKRPKGEVPLAQRLPIDLGPSNNLVLRPPTTSGVSNGGVGSSIESPRSLWVVNISLLLGLGV